jgi:hypothetical protein
MRYKHGMSRTPEHESWRSLKKRCLCKTCKAYKYYGGRGITVCERWRDSFENFLADMGPKPSPKHSIDRINVNGNYEPSNCRWATWSQQVINRNKMGSNSSGITGVHWDKKSQRWSAQIRIGGDRKCLTFPNIEQAIETRKRWEQERSSLI